MRRGTSPLRCAALACGALAVCAHARPVHAQSDCRPLAEVWQALKEGAADKAKNAANSAVQKAAWESGEAKTTADIEATTKALIRAQHCYEEVRVRSFNVTVSGGQSQRMFLVPEQRKRFRLNGPSEKAPVELDAALTIDERSGEPNLDLVPVPAPPTVPLAPMVIAQPVPPRSWAPTIVAGAVAVAAAAGFGIEWWVADGAADKYEQLCRASTSGTCDDFRSHLSDSERARGRRDIFLATSIFSAALAVYLGWDRGR